MRGREKSNRGREVGEKGEGSGGDGGGNWGEWGRELGMWYPPVHPLFVGASDLTNAAAFPHFFYTNMARF